MDPVASRPAVALLAALACRSPALVCTAIGCDDGLQVDITATVAQGTVTIEASAPGTPTRMASCTLTNGRCLITLGQFTPDAVTLVVTSSAGTVTTSLQPAYTISRPNGPDCPPTCRSARVAVLV